jgi:hypothetical protein
MVFRVSSNIFFFPLALIALPCIKRAIKSEMHTLAGESKKMSSSFKKMMNIAYLA